MSDVKFYPYHTRQIPQLPRLPSPSSLALSLPSLSGIFHLSSFSLFCLFPSRLSLVSSVSPPSLPFSLSLSLPSLSGIFYLSSVFLSPVTSCLLHQLSFTYSQAQLSAVLGLVLWHLLCQFCAVSPLPECQFVPSVRFWSVSSFLLSSPILSLSSWVFFPFLSIFTSLLFSVVLFSFFCRLSLPCFSLSLFFSFFFLSCLDLLLFMSFLLSLLLSSHFSFSSFVFSSLLS